MNCGMQGPSPATADLTDQPQQREQQHLLSENCKWNGLVAIIFMSAKCPPLVKVRRPSPVSVEDEIVRLRALLFELSMPG